MEVYTFSRCSLQNFPNFLLPHQTNPPLCFPCLLFCYLVTSASNSHEIGEQFTSPDPAGTAHPKCLITQLPFLPGEMHQARPSYHVCIQIPLTQRPVLTIIVSRVRRIIQVDQDVQSCSNAASFVIALATVKPP
jgi:hypothetical protein